MSLIARLEAAEAGEEGLSAELCVLFQYGGLNSEGATNVRTDDEWEGDLLFEQDGEDCCNRIPPVTTSLDAALALAERVLPGCFPGVSQNVHSGIWFSWLGRNDVGEPKLYSEAFGKTAPIAICKAVLKAKETK